MTEKRQPWMKWYPADWRDPRLRMCSLAARGLWADMISYMHEGEPYGHLTVAGVAVSAADLASLVGQSPADVRKALAELESKSVYSTTESGVIFSRRMVRDKVKAERDKENGKGGGNPKITASDKRWVNPQDNGEDKAHIPEAIAREKEPPNPRKRGGLSAEQSSEFEGWYALYPHKVGRGAAERAWPAARALASVTELSEGVARYIAAKRPDVAWCNPATWLNAKRWLDAPAEPVLTVEAAKEAFSQADRDALRAKWAGRLGEFKQTGKWQTTWGAEPWSGNHGCRVPLDMRADFENARIATDPWLAKARELPREAAQ